jgi:LacI family transcriptional regulator
MVNRHKVTLLFSANKIYDRQVIQGIGKYIQISQNNWDIYIEEDFTSRLDLFKYMKVDGVIADFDNPTIERLLSDFNVPVVGVGGSYEHEQDYPSVPYVATDNYALVDMAFQHLHAKGLQNFAFYGLPYSSTTRWAKERENAFKKIVKDHGHSGSIYIGNETNPETWQYDMNRLSDWVQNLPTPVGIIAVTDARARHLLQLCDHFNIMVPDKVSIIGIDNEELTRYLTRISLSSVEQGANDMGYRAAKILNRLMRNFPDTNLNLKKERILVEPIKVIERQSSDFQSLRDPYVIRAMHFIRNNACKGVKVEHVLDYVGISRSNLENRFKNEKGHSIHQEIHNSKLNHACNLLQTTDLPISEIAEVCGYQTSHYMYAVFKKDLEITPNECRKLGQ